MVETPLRFFKVDEEFFLQDSAKFCHTKLRILYKELKLPGSLHRTLQILSVHPFEKIALHELLMKNEFRKPNGGDFNQMELFDL